jgi:hypothetical protein
MSIEVRPLSDDLPFGARITGVTRENSRDAAVRAQINDVFTDRGMIVFEKVEPSNSMQVALSEVFGELEDHALSDVPMADDEIRGMTDFTYEDIFEVNGEKLSGFVPWHFDACYTDALNRGGILRALVISPEGGLTGFADGIQLYNAIDPALRARFEDLEVIYHSHLMFTNLKFGRPASYKGLKVRQMIIDMLENTKNAVRPSGDLAAHDGREGVARRTMAGRWHRRNGDARRRHTSGGDHPRDGSEDDALFPRLEADRHGDLGQLALRPCRERQPAAVPAPHAAHDDQGRLRTGPARAPGR